MKNESRDDEEKKRAGHGSSRSHPGVVPSLSLAADNITPSPPQHDQAVAAHKQGSSLVCGSRGAAQVTMSLMRSSLRIVAPRARLQVVPNITRSTQRPLSSTAARKAGDSHAHEDHYDPPGGWLWGVKPGEKYENEGWENVWFYGMYGTLAFGVIGYWYKPDTSIQTWALEEARRRLEAEGVLEDPDNKR